MYSSSTALPFIVFHYPPLYHLFARVAFGILPDFLAAGRLVSALSTIPISLSVIGIVIIATKRAGETQTWTDYAIALAAGLLILCLHAVRSWGMLMRVDMLAIAFAMTGLLIGAWANGRFLGVVCALFLCAAAVFTKQTELPAGIAIFLVTLLRNPRNALGAAAIVGATCLAVLALLQHLTSGGFLLNIIGYNINPFSIGAAHWALLPEAYSFPVALIALLGVWTVCQTVVPGILRGRLTKAAQQMRALRTANAGTACRALALMYFALSTLMLVTIFKAGSSYNYLIDWLVIGSAFIGIMLSDLARGKVWRGWAFPAAVSYLLMAVALQPSRQMADSPAPSDLAWQEAVVRRIAAADKPVASENMTLLMRAGKQVVFEPAIVSDLARLGRWNETPLVQMIRSDGFAFMITSGVRGNNVGGSHLRTPAVDSAMREAYPRVEEIGPNVWLHLPPP